MRTLEQRIKFDHGLPIGQSLVKFTHDGAEPVATIPVKIKDEW